MKPFLIGCGIVLLLIVGAVIAAVVFLPDVIKRGMEMASEAIAAEQERQALAVGWTPPAPNEPAEQIFPAQLATYKRTSTEETTGIPQLAIRQPGRHAVYESGAGKIDAYVFPTTPQQRAALLKQVDDLNKRQGSTSWIKIDLGDDYARVHLSSDSLDTNYLWFTKTHLVVFRTADKEDREPVLKAFFTARQAAAPVKPTATQTGTADVKKTGDDEKDGDDPKKEDSAGLMPRPSAPILVTAA